MTKHKDDAKQDRAVEDSFPASDPPATSGIVGPRAVRPGQTSRQAPAKRDDASRPMGTPTHERHAADTAARDR
jgi:hypothetical protein